MSHKVYGLSLKARCVQAQLASADRNRFLVGTFGLREENEVHLIDVREDAGGTVEISCENIYNHPREIWSLSPCPFDAALFFTVYNTVKEFKVSLWRTNDPEPGLTEVVELQGHNGRTRSVLWNRESETMQSAQVVTIDEDTIKLWHLARLGEGAAHQTVGKQSQTIKPGSTEVSKFTAGSWDPHHQHEIATIHDRHVDTWDLRSNKKAHSIQNAHKEFVRDLHFNPNRLYYLATGGDDSYIKFWDLRNSKQPAQVLLGHSHWIWNVRYNRHHDQLVLSCSSDGSVKLWNASSVASPPVDPAAQDRRKEHKDYCVRSYDDHVDSVYAVAWSAGREFAYTFASLSYDGRLVINTVPQEERLKVQMDS